MTEIVERVARALHKAISASDSDVFVGDDADLTNVMIDGQVDLLEIASAAIEAMRLPTDVMDEAGLACGMDRSHDIYWEAMIRAALAP